LTQSLEPVHAAAPLQEICRRHLGMDDSGSGRHPLHVAGAQSSMVSAGVAVLHSAGEQIGHRLEAAMGVVRRSLGLPGRRIGRAHLIEQQERVDLVERGSRERAVDEKASTLEGLDARKNSFDAAGFLHDAGSTPATSGRIRRVV
jgi:hypothetical protein